MSPAAAHFLLREETMLGIFLHAGGQPLGVAAFSARMRGPGEGEEGPGSIECA